MPSCLFSGRRFEATFEYAQWRKIKQMRLCSFSDWPLVRVVWVVKLVTVMNMVKVVRVARKVRLVELVWVFWVL